jgi:putative acetyltransferase
LAVEPLVVAAEDPRRADIELLLAAHLAFAHQHSPPQDVHALDIDDLCAPAITFLTARAAGRLLGVGALKELDATRAELKSMHTAITARGRGVGSQMLTHLLGLARERGYDRVSLETGTAAVFEPAQRLYAAAGFTVCAPFAAYTDSEYSLCMTLALR